MLNDNVKIARQKLISVLCGPDDKCCIHGSEADRKEVDEALALLDQQAEPKFGSDKSRLAAARDVIRNYEHQIAALLSFVQKTRDGNKPWTNIDDCPCENCTAWKSACDTIIAEIEKMMGAK